METNSETRPPKPKGRNVRWVNGRWTDTDAVVQDTLYTTVVLDVSYPSYITAEQACDELVAELDAWYEIVNEHGSGGGWPEVAFTGRPTHIGILVYRYCGEDTEQATHILNTCVVGLTLTRGV